MQINKRRLTLAEVMYGVGALALTLTGACVWPSLFVLGPLGLVTAGITLYVPASKVMGMGLDEWLISGLIVVVSVVLLIPAGQHSRCGTVPRPGALSEEASGLSEGPPGWSLTSCPSPSLWSEPPPPR
jgi:hypothetical protein